MRLLVRDAAGIIVDDRTILELSFTLEPDDDETLLSYVHRLAWQVGVPPRAIACTLGLVPDRPSTATRSRAGFGITISDERARAFCHASHLPPQRLHAMLLSSVDGPLEHFPVTWSAGRHGLAIRTPDSLACPVCVATSGTWRLSWKLAPFTCCLRHSEPVELIELCTRCGARLHPGGATHTSAGRLLETVPVDPTHCAAPVRRGSPSVCGHPAAEWPHRPPDTDVVDAQRTIDTIYRDRPAANGPMGLPADQWWQACRLIAAIATHAMRPDLVRPDADSGRRVRYAHWPTSVGAARTGVPLAVGILEQTFDEATAQIAHLMRAGKVDSARSLVRKNLKSATEPLVSLLEDVVDRSTGSAYRQHKIHTPRSPAPTPEEVVELVRAHLKRDAPAEVDDERKVFILSVLVLGRLSPRTMQRVDLVRLVAPHVAKTLGPDTITSSAPPLAALVVSIARQWTGPRVGHASGIATSLRK